MRRLILFLSASLLTISALGQVANRSFENWTQKTGFKELDDWATSDAFTRPLFGSEHVDQSPDASDGSFAVLLQSKFIIALGQDVPGLITSGTLSVNLSTGEVAILGGDPFPYRPQSVKFDYKCLPVGGDTAIAAVLLKRRHQGQTDTIAYAIMREVDTVAVYTTKELMFNYVDTSTPDTLLIVFASSNSAGGAVDGSQLLVDNIRVVFPIGVEVPLHKIAALKVYPNPAARQVRVVNPFQEARTLRVFDLRGRLVYTVQLNPGSQLLPVHQLGAGVYIYRLETKSDEAIHQGRLVVQ